MSGTKQIIYETAKRLFLEEGYNVGSRKIAEVAGVNQGLITYYFKSKKNIAIAMLREIYEIVSSYVRYQTSPQKDTFLYILSCTDISIRICNFDPKYYHLMTQLSEKNLFQESICSGMNQTELYKKIIKDNMPPNNYSLEKNFDIVTGIVFGAVRNLFPIVDLKSDSNFTLKEFTELFIRTFVWALHLNYTEDDFSYLLNRIDDISDNVFNKNPDFKNPMVFLFQNSKLQQILNEK